ncbi:ribosome biogenesis GTPase Der [Psittacicella melopsittaci]|uniref:GTPase Der n=1 Tax=Psittacicella melopsittaci TaxID=2028576 RepID=A0A3A1Y744_9GAMM|nr:ribosome biogenesis GTPase Der [Psittacicella melopsittaci]RIY33089.1 ribosome biogenesis GTPase Der [Psittacicella melopsittaci]
MLPNQKTVIALVGRPNVGKSTLFNRLTKTRDALVADFPGLTRDRKYGIARYQDQEYILIDTGGLEGNEEGIETKMAEQSLLAIQEADIVFMLVDARAGLIPGDTAIVNLLRKREKPVILVANKIDGLDKEQALADFYVLGFDKVMGISSSNNIGVSSLLDFTFDFIDSEKVHHSDDADFADQEQALYDDQDDEEFEEEQELIDEEFEYLDESEIESKIHDVTEASIRNDLDERANQLLQNNIKIALVGRPNVGKSTLTNCLLGEDRVIVYDMPGTTRDSIYIPLEHNGQNYTIIDTAGVRRKGKIYEAVEKFSVIKTLQAIEDANVCLLVIDATQGLADQDLSLLSFILNAGRSIVILLNKWDAVTDDERKAIRDEIDRKLGFANFARIHYISALKKHGIGDIFKYVQEAYLSANVKVNTSMLTRILQMALHAHQPPQVNGRRVKLKYAHAGGHNPPIIVVHGNMSKELPESYKKYLINYFRKTLNIIGSPINFKFEDSKNPYKDKRNKLTKSQIRKRKRLQKFIKRQS